MMSERDGTAQEAHEMTNGSSHMGIFYNRDEALKWLGFNAEQGGILT